MKKVLFALLAIILTSAAAQPLFAQKGNGKPKDGKHGDFKSMTPDQRAQKATDRMTKRYGLNATQVTAVQAANLEHAKQMENIKGLHKTDKTKFQAEHKALQEAHKAKLKTIFTPEQNTKFEADLVAAKARHEAHKAGKDGQKGEHHEFDVLDSQDTDNK